jgi:hypothetical protein
MILTKNAGLYIVLVTAKIKYNKPKSQYVNKFYTA